MIKSVVLSCALLIPCSAFSQTLTEPEKNQVHEMCLGFSMIAKGIMQARQEGESRESVNGKMQDVITQKGGVASAVLQSSTQVLLNEAYTVPVASDPKKAQDIQLAFGVATYTRCMERIPAAIEKNRQKSATQ